ncbi:hypothetical protein [Chelativorans sp. AA-79]|uniref:hypothetical protein n=1 Tax=Chelativorans sp. AA-79 TaxID=3028735 RepID=UPI0023F713C2|nr:hypothetical protein [Chelativorans sp. AA-79]WEX08258.1 hypothetical protein PVE73_19580 [Chelativorans sp. AA-79]
MKTRVETPALHPRQVNAETGWSLRSLRGPERSSPGIHRLPSYLSLVAAILRRTPLHFSAIVLLVLVSQILFFATIWLPWKVLVVLSGAEPRLMPETVGVLSQQDQVLILGFTAVLAYLLHLASEKAIGWLCMHGAGKQRSASGKTGLFNNQREVAEQLYRKLVRCLADACFVAVALSLLFLLYPALPFLFLGWSILFGTATWCAAICSRPTRHWISKSLGWVLGVYANAGFFCALGWLIYAHWRGVMPMLYISFIALFVMRLALQQSASIVLNLRGLVRQRSQAMALFLPDVPWPSQLPRNSPFGDLSLEANRVRWIRKLVESREGVIQGDWTIRMSAMECGNVSVFFVSITSGGDPSDGPSGYLVKLFNHTRDALAQQEADLLNVEGPSLPTFEWLGETKVKGYLCHLMRWEPQAERMENAAHGQAAGALRIQLLSHDPSPTLIEKYRRSRPDLRARLKPDMCDMLLRSIADEKQIQCVEHLRDIWDDLVHVLDDLPVQLTLPWLNAQSLYKRQSGQYCLHHWAGWCLEPVGAGWPLSPRTSKELHDALQKAAKIRPALQSVTPRAAELSARLFEFERRFSISNYNGAANMAPKLLRAYSPDPSAIP